MRFRIIVAGKPALAYARTAVEEYLKRLSRHGGCELTVVKAGVEQLYRLACIKSGSPYHRD